MMQNGSPRKRWNVVIGTPDPDHCPICRAHQGPPDLVIPSEMFGPILANEIPIGKALRCPCPLCVQARPHVVDEGE